MILSKNRFGQLNPKIKVLDKGEATLLDVMPRLVEEGQTCDSAIAQMARTSYQKGTKTLNDDRSLIRYLMRHKHCYHPDMQVLTGRGWISWKDCKQEEEFAVPNPISKEIVFEKCKLLSFDHDDDLICVKNDKFSFKVTKNHKIWFDKGKSSKYKLYNAEEEPAWGNLEGIKNHALKIKEADKYKYEQGKFLGFFLGDGYKASTNRIGFHLKKQRKIDYLENLLKELNLEYRKNYTEKDTVQYLVHIPAFISSFIDIEKPANEKELINTIYSSYERNILSGILDGLINSDGCINTSRSYRVEYSSGSYNLAKTFQDISSLFGYESHFQKKFNTYIVHSIPENSKELEIRKQYYYKEKYQGKVFCTTTSTGLLIVRGSEDSFAFLCGNSSPIEGVEFKFLIKLPLFVQRTIYSPPHF